MTQEDRERLHQLLDYAIDNSEDYVIGQFAKMSLEYQVAIRRYRLHINVEDEVIN